MEEVEEVLKKIEELRKDMNEMIDARGNLLDSKVIELSRRLDESLVEYHKLLKKNNG